MRYMPQGLRALRRRPILTTVALVSLALGVGGTTALFGILNVTLLNPLFLPEPDRLVAIFTVDKNNRGYFPTSSYNYRDYRDQNAVFSQLSAFTVTNLGFSMRGQTAQQVQGQVVTANYFETLGVAPFIGRVFQPDEDEPDAPQVAILGHRFWQTALGSDPAVVGSYVELNRQPFLVVGILPASFRGIMLTFSPDVWVPVGTYARLFPGTPVVESRRWRWLNIVGRLKPEVSLTEAQSHMSTIASGLELSYPDVNKGRSVLLIPLLESMIQPDQRSSYVRGGWLLGGAAALVLLIVCINVGHLHLVRGAERLPELATRLALGASRRHVVAQLLTESVAIAVLGGLASLLVAMWVQQSLWSLRPAFLSHTTFDLRLDARTLGFGVALSLAAGLLSGLAPAIHLARTNLATWLKVRQGGGRRRLARWIVVSEVGFATVALVLACFSVGSLVLAHRIDPGFQAERLIFLSMNLATGGYDEPRGRVFGRQLLAHIASIPGVERAALSDRLPLNLTGAVSYTIEIEGQPLPPSGLGATVPISIATPGYFSTTGIGLIAGRDFVDTDDEDAPLVAIVNETMARRFWPNESALGKRFRTIVRPGWFQVVGVAHNARYTSLGENAGPFFHVSMLQQYRPAVTVVARTRVNPNVILPRVRESVQRLDPQIPISHSVTGPELVSQALWAPRMTAVLFGAFAVLAVLLSTVGIYGIIAYAVAQRRTEIALRMALGANEHSVMRMLIGETLLCAGAGVVLGIGLAAATIGVVSPVFYTSRSGNALSLALSGVVLILTALVACYRPARRIARLDAALVLRAG